MARRPEMAPAVAASRALGQATTMLRKIGRMVADEWEAVSDDEALALGMEAEGVEDLASEVGLDLWGGDESATTRRPGSTEPFESVSNQCFCAPLTPSGDADSASTADNSGNNDDLYDGANAFDWADAYYADA